MAYIQMPGPSFNGVPSLPGEGFALRNEECMCGWRTRGLQVPGVMRSIQQQSALRDTSVPLRVQVKKNWALVPKTPRAGSSLGPKPLSLGTACCSHDQRYG